MVSKLLFPFLFLLLINSSAAQNRGLWVNNERVGQLRVLVEEPNSHHQRAFAQMKAYVDASAVDVITVPNRLGSNWNYDRSYLAQQAALISLLSNDSEVRGHYATMTYDALRAMYDDPDSGGHQLLGSNQHLSKATVAMGFVLGYEWCAEVWTVTQRDWVMGKMLEALNGWTSLGHTNFGGDSSSNWLAVVRGAEMSMMLAAGEEGNRPLRYRNLRSWLLNNANTHGPRGWGQEGNYYMSYGQIFAIPAMIAAGNMGDPEMALALSQKQLHLVPLFGSMFSESFDAVNWGVGGSIWDGGFASLTMAITPEGEKPYIRWWYDRFMGIHSPAPESVKYDRDRQGRVWSILYYPDHVEAADPAEHYPLAIEDTGGFFLRSGWQDEDEVVVFLGTDRAAYSPGWDGPDALSLVVLGQGNRYISGAGSTAYLSTAKDLFSTILINDAVPSTGRTGGREYFGLNDQGAYVIATGGSAYSNMGMATAHRHLLADFSAASGQTALLGLRDKLVSSGNAHEYRWQINTGEGQVVLGNQGGRPTFTISHEGNGGYMRGWVISPANASLSVVGSRLFFNTTAVSADIWVVMAVGEGTPPEAVISGTGMGSTFLLNGVSMSYDGASDRLINSELQFTPPPVATFTVSATSGPAPLAVTVNASGSSSAAGISSYEWDFGDGTKATGVSAEHTYTEPGIYAISLGITDAAGRHEVANRTVVAGYRWPTASFSVSPSTGQPPLQVTINPGATNHPNGLPLTYEWDLGDGTTFTRTDNNSFTHTYNSGTYTVSLKVTDGNGGFDALTRSVSATNRAPTAAMDWSVGGGSVPLTVNFSAARSSDPDGDLITYHWNFGDGTTSTEISPVHTFTTVGNYYVTLTVTDALGAEGSFTMSTPIQVRDGTNPIVAVDPSTLPDLLRGLEYGFYYNDIDSGTGRMPFYLTPDLITFLWSGVIDNFLSWPSNLTDRYVFRYRGYLDVPTEGVYTFYVDARNGVQLLVGGQELIRNSTRFGNTNSWSTVALEAGLQEVDFIYFANESGTGPFYPYLQMSWSGPGFDKQLIDSDRLYWRPGRPQPDFLYSIAPDSAVSPVTYSFDAATSQVFGSDSIVSYEWTFPGNVIKTGRTVTHSFSGGDQRVILEVTTSSGATATAAKTIKVRTPQNFEIAGGTDRALMPGKIIRARGQFLPNGLMSGAFDGDKTTRWLDLSLSSWIEIEFRHNGQLQPYVVSEYRFTSLTLWNERDPYSWNLYGSNNGVDWTLLHAVTANSFSGSHPRTNVFTIPNTTAYSFYRFGEIQATATSSAPDAVGLNLIELIDYGTGNQPSSVPPTASFNADNYTPAVGQIFALDGSNSADPDGYPLYYHWNFGDGQSAQGWELSQVSYTYNTPGTYEVVMTVTDALGDSAFSVQQLTSSVVPNADPIASYTVASSAPTGWTELVFDASASFDPDGDPISFRWEFGDGMVAEGPVVVHTMGVGKYTPLLVVTDDRGGRGTYAQEVIIGVPNERPLSIGVNHSGRSDEYNDMLQPNEVAGLVPQGFWNNIDATVGGPLLDSNGDVTSTTYSRSGGYVYGGATLPRSADHRMMVTGAGGAQTFVNVPYAVYDVYVYHSTRRETDSRDESWFIRLTSDSKVETRFFRQSTFAWNGYYNISDATTAAAAIDEHNVVVFTGITDRNFTLSNGSHQNRTMTNAIQIVDASGGTIIPPINPPAVPLNFAASAFSSSAIALTWEAPFGVIAGYRVERALQGSSTWTQVADTQALEFFNTGLTPETAYQYRIRAYNSGGSSEWSTPVLVSTLEITTILPAVPSGLVATSTSATSIFVEWTPVSGPLDGYRLQRAAGGTGNWTQIADSLSTSFNVTDLAPGSTHEFRVLAYNEAGPSAWAEPVEATTPGEFGDGEQVPVVSWGKGQYYHNAEGVGNYAGLPGVVSGSTLLNGQLTGYRLRPFGAASVLPAYTPEGPPSGRFNFAGIIFSSVGTTSAPTVFFRLDGRIENSSLTQISYSTSTSSSQYAAQAIWWSKADFLSGFNEEALNGADTIVVADVSIPSRILVKENGSFYISQSTIGDSAVSLSSLTWAPYDPAKEGGLGLFANVAGDVPSSVDGLIYTPVVFENIEAIGLYAERIATGAYRTFALYEFRVIAFLPETTPSENSFAGWQQRAGFTPADLADPTISGPNADPRNSGISNLMRHALGLEFDTPVSANLTRLYQSGPAVDQLHFSFPRNAMADDIDVILQESPDLVSWTDVGSEWSLVSAEPIPETEGRETVVWAMNRSLASDEQVFIRLKVVTRE